MGLPENIDALLVKYDITQEALARVAGVAPSSITRWRNGAQMRRDYLVKICDYFDLSEDDLLSNDYGLAAKEHGRAPSFHLPPGAHPITSGKPAYLPLKGKIHAGKPIEAIETEGFYEVPTQIADNHPAGIVLLVEGDCMNRVYPEGCHVVVDPNVLPEDGQIGAFLIDGDIVMRRVKKGSTMLLLTPDSYTDGHEDLIYSNSEFEEVMTIGKVVWYQAPEEL